MRSALLTGLTAACLMAGGCKHTPTQPPEPVTFNGCPMGDIRKGSTENLLKAKVLVEGPSTNVRVIELQCRASIDGRLKVQATLRNPTSAPSSVAYRFRWLDRYGTVSEDQEAWKPLMMYQHSTEIVTGTATSPQVKDFRLVVMGQE